MDFYLQENKRYHSQFRKCQSLSGGLYLARKALFALCLCMGFGGDLGVLETGILGLFGSVFFTVSIVLR